MAILPIVMEGDPGLRDKCAPVKKVTNRIERLIKDMFETMYQAGGCGLAAPQVGVPERIIVIDVGDDPFALINPVIEESSGTDVDVERCLSVPQKMMYVARAAEVRVSGLSDNGRPVRLAAEGWLARTLQHEIDHLDGILFIDRAAKPAPKD